ncbi:hypothetical protein NQZ68_032636, partial [Dissostichus eleginoides]
MHGKLPTPDHEPNRRTIVPRKTMTSSRSQRADLEPARRGRQTPVQNWTPELDPEGIANISL